MAGYREFQTGEILTSANVNEFLMEQAVLTFPDAAARTAALAGVLREGILTYNEDTAQLEVYDGTAFVVAAPAPPAGIGSNVVQTFKDDTFSTTSTSFTDVTGLSATITPSTDTSKVLVIVTLNGLGTSSASGAPYHRFNLRRGSSDIAQPSGGTTPATLTVYQGTIGSPDVQSASMAFLDSPGVNTAVTYGIQMAVSAQTGFVNRVGGDAQRTTVSSITAIEVAV